MNNNDGGFPPRSFPCLTFYNSSFFVSFYSTLAIPSKFKLKLTMSASAPEAEGFPFQPHFQFPIKYRKIETFSHLETEAWPPFKNPKKQVMLHQPTTRNFKTQLCRRFRSGLCALGSKCNYAHGVAELRRQGIVAKLDDPLAHPQTFGGDGDSRMFQEPKLCRMFTQKKQCTYGDTCRFLHLGSREGAMITGPAPGYGKNGYGHLELKGAFNASFDSPKRMMLNAKMCINWEIKGYCPFGNICRFPHGLAELRKVDGYSSAEHMVIQTSAAANASTSTEATSPLHKKEPYGVKCTFKKNELQKISRIYADWI